MGEHKYLPMFTNGVEKILIKHKRFTEPNIRKIMI